MHNHPHASPESSPVASCLSIVGFKFKQYYYYVKKRGQQERIPQYLTPPESKPAIQRHNNYHRSYLNPTWQAQHCYPTQVILGNHHSTSVSRQWIISMESGRIWNQCVSLFEKLCFMHWFMTREVRQPIRRMKSWGKTVRHAIFFSCFHTRKGKNIKRWIAGRYPRGKNPVLEIFVERGSQGKGKI